MTTAKTLCYALDLPLIAVDALAAIATAGFHANPDAERICVALDAYRSQVYSGTFGRSELLPSLDNMPANWSPHPTGVEVLSSERWRLRLRELPEVIGCAGDAKPFADTPGRVLERACDAIGVGLLGVRAWRSGLACDPLALIPRYLKLSAAEEKLLRPNVPFEV